MIYFAYGSNMCAKLLAERLAREGHVYSDRRHATAHGFRLTFDKRSSIEPGVGYANIQPHPGARVEGTLNLLSEAAVELLDRVELVPVQYYRAPISVHDSWSGREIEAFAYFAQPDVIDSKVRPMRVYVERLLSASDILPSDYVRSLEAVECWE